VGQIDKLIQAAEKKLKASERTLEIDEACSYEMAYNAMLHAARAFLFMKGFRPTTNFQHKTVVSFAEHFLGEEYKALTAKFDHMRKNRNKFIYEPWKLHLSKTDTQKALQSARRFIDIIKKEIKKIDPQKQFKF
jgi:uncharacterized protein (UPF0332 family)